MVRAAQNYKGTCGFLEHAPSGEYSQPCYISGRALLLVFKTSRYLSPPKKRFRTIANPLNYIILMVSDLRNRPTTTMGPSDAISAQSEATPPSAWQLLRAKQAPRVGSALPLNLSPNCLDTWRALP